MNNQRFYLFLQKQILLMIGLSLIPGLAYIFLGWLNDIVMPALVWYALMVLVSLYGWRLYHQFKIEQMDTERLRQWYGKLSVFFYIIFALWTLIFLLYCTETEHHLHYIAIFTQIGASVVASALLVSDKKLFFPVLLILLLPLIVYFAMIGEWYGYVLSIFSTIFLGVLLYAADNSYRLIQKNYYQAQHDSLTGLYNRRFFVEYMEQVIARLRYSERFVYIVLIDLDHFKTINDTLGHDIGDKMLIEVAERIRNYCGQSHTIARLGGDEFTIVSGEFEKEVNCKQVAGSFAQTLLRILKEPYLIDGHHLYLSASIGINSVGHKTADAKHFIKEADIAMYEAKAKGRDGIIIFNDDLAQRVEHHLEIERRLYFALEHREIELMYQPQLNAQQQLTGCEVLVRWKSPKFGFVLPSEFIQVAEKTGLIIEMGNYIIEEAFKTLKQWDSIGIELEQFSINISVRQFFNSEFPDDIEYYIKTYLDSRLAQKVVFEVTETIFIEDIQRILEAMKRIKQLGISFSMDDFGTGYSSLSSLRDMPIGELKIDKSFVMRVGEHRSDEQMISTILSMARVFNLKTVAEGVENEAQFQFLLKNGCDIFQGFYFSKPLTKEDFQVFAQKTVNQKQFSTLVYEI